MGMITLRIFCILKWSLEFERITISSGIRFEFEWKNNFSPGKKLSGGARLFVRNLIVGLKKFYKFL